MSNKDSDYRLSLLPIIFRKALGIGSWVQGSIREVGEHAEAQSYLQAPGQGEKALKITEAEIRKTAKKLGKPVTHRVYAANERSQKLFIQTKGYTLIGTDDDGALIFEKEILP